MEKIRQGKKGGGLPVKTAFRLKYHAALGTRLAMYGSETATSHILPPVPKRWVAHRKAEVIAAVTRGTISLDDALHRYALTLDEYLAWQRSVRLFGLLGLSMNKLQQERSVRVQPRAPSKLSGPQYGSFGKAKR